MIGTGIECRGISAGNPRRSAGIRRTKADSFREILRPKLGLRMTDFKFHSMFPQPIQPSVSGAKI